MCLVGAYDCIDRYDIKWCMIWVVVYYKWRWQDWLAGWLGISSLEYELDGECFHVSFRIICV